MMESKMNCDFESSKNDVIPASYFYIENDKAYINIPMREYGNDICKTQFLFTKENFQELYKKWIVEEGLISK